MAFDSKKWANTFNGVVDEKFAVETDLFFLHIHRRMGIKKLVAERSERKLDIYIPQNWDMEEYCYQDKMRKMLIKEIKWQAQRIYEQHTNVIAKRIGRPTVRVSVDNNWRNGCCHYKDNHICYNMWTVCEYNNWRVNELVCHELAHFYVPNHSKSFWRKQEQIFYGLESDKECTGKKLELVKEEILKNSSKTYFKLSLWAKPFVFNQYFENGRIKDPQAIFLQLYEVID